mmetsp:Transcript_13881/g.20965  ORF Transcript_13881/g.20965 Transcript_13881/m.20965 type:complete len:94 (-) Transcript_13881:148-429(-)
MIKYISKKEHLSLVIDGVVSDDHKKKGIRFEAFHVFKFFVANPKKPQEIVDLLLSHKSRLLTALNEMKKHNEDGSVDYGRELPLLIDKLTSLE